MTVLQLIKLIQFCIMILCFYTHRCLPHIKAYTTQTLDKFKEWILAYRRHLELYFRVALLPSQRLSDAHFTLIPSDLFPSKHLISGLGQHDCQDSHWLNKNQMSFFIIIINVKLKVLLWWLFMTVGTFQVKGALFVILMCPSDSGLSIYQPGSVFTTPAASHLICLFGSFSSVSLRLISRTLTQARLCAAACLNISFFHSYWLCVVCLVNLSHHSGMNCWLMLCLSVYRVCYIVWFVKCLENWQKMLHKVIIHNSKTWTVISTSTQLFLKINMSRVFISCEWTIFIKYYIFIFI